MTIRQFGDYTKRDYVWQVREFALSRPLVPTEVREL